MRHTVTEPVTVALDVGDVLVTTRPGLQWEGFGQLAGLSASEARDRLEAGDLITTFSLGQISVASFVFEVSARLSLQVPAAAILNVWCTVIGDVVGEIAEAALCVADIGRLVLATNTDEAHLGQVLAMLGPAWARVAVIASSRVGARKPDAGFWSTLAAHCRGRFILVDDDIDNVRAARAWGFSGWHHTDASTTAGLLRDVATALSQTDAACLSASSDRR